MFDKLLKEYCVENDFEIREYSGRYGANGLMGIVIPNGMRFFGIFVQEFTLKLIDAEKESVDTNKDCDVDSSEAFEVWDRFIKTLEFDSMGRDEQVIYSREFKWNDFQNAIEKDFEDED